MTTAREAAERPVKWQTGSLRVTVFYTGLLDVVSVNWWESLTGQQPDSKNVRAPGGQLIELGTVEGQVLHLQIQPGRIDWLLLPKDDPDSETFSLLGDFAKSSTYFGNLISKWFEQAPPLNRIAFGAQLFIPTADQPEAIRIVATILLCVKMKWEGVRDFIFQVNRPRACETLPGLGAINRLARWQTIARRKVTAILLPQPQAPVMTSEEHAAFCELDISTNAPTDADTIKLPPDALRSLLTELIKHAADIVSKGDVL